MWGLPGPGIEPATPTLAGEFFTAEPPGKPCFSFSCSEFGVLFYPKTHLKNFFFVFLFWNNFR